MITAFFLLRRDLEMSDAKLAVQVGHGTDFIHMSGKDNTSYAGWLNGADRRKIVLEVNTEDHLTNIIMILERIGTRFDVIEDWLGSEFEGKRVTGVVVHPLEEQYLPKKLKRLRLWS